MESGSILDPTGDPEADAITQRFLDAMKLLQVGAVFFARSWRQLINLQVMGDAGASEEAVEAADIDPVVLFEGVATLDPATGRFHLTPEGVLLLRLGEQLLSASADDAAGQK